MKKLISSDRMFKPIDPFLKILPQLDVHGYTEDTVMTVVNDFIDDTEDKKHANLRRKYQIWYTKVNGYFVGQLFGDRDGWKDNKLINTFTMEEVKAYLKRYKILKLDEIEYTRESDNKKWHFYNIIAKKEVI